MTNDLAFWRDVFGRGKALVLRLIYYKHREVVSHYQRAFKGQDSHERAEFRTKYFDGIKELKKRLHQYDSRISKQPKRIRRTLLTAYKAQDAGYGHNQLIEADLGLLPSCGVVKKPGCKKPAVFVKVPVRQSTGVIVRKANRA